MKILSPAGNFESLKMAIFNGADEVYLGINDFNARNNIDGFNMQNLKEAVDFAHVFDVKVDLAINILFSDDELQRALDIVVDAYNMGVDAFIIQDLGLAKLVFENYPKIEIHASTQMGLHNLEGVTAVEKFGFKRVVLSRETPLEEIKRIRKNSGVEIEYFAQGALCVSFSGNCYLSSYLCNASGNRGRCKQLCRLPYSFEKNGKKIKEGYLLSAKDFNMIARLQELKDAGVDVIKIEGRARRPFYVATATREYYNALHGKEVDVEKLKLAFNRNFTAGYFDGNGNIISNIQNHIGICVGKVEKIVAGKKFNEVFLSSNRKLSEKSTFKFFEKDKEKTTLSAFDMKEVSPGKYRLTTTQKVAVGDKVNLIVDAGEEEAVLKTIKRRKVKIKLFAREQENVRASIDLGQGVFEVVGEICEKANSQPLSDQQFVTNFNKSEFFDADLEICSLDNVFMPKQKLNDFRRKVFDEVFKRLTKPFEHDEKRVLVEINQRVKRFVDFQVVEDLQENFIEKNIVFSPNEYSIEQVKCFQNKCKMFGKNAFLDTPNFALEEDIKFLKEIVDKTKISVVANNYYALSLGTDIVIGAGLNVYNCLSAQVFDRPVLTAESDVATRVKFPYMTLRHCPFKSHMKANCLNCPYDEGYIYKMNNGKVLKLKRKKLSTCTFYLTD